MRSGDRNWSLYHNNRSGEQSRAEEGRGEERFSTNCGRILLAEPYTKHY